MNPRVAAVVLAAGSGSRLESGINKVYLEVAGREMLGYSIRTFVHSDLITDLVIVARPEDRSHVDRLLSVTAFTKPMAVVDGGATRHQSEFAALLSLAKSIDGGGIDLVAIHDGARPFMTDELLSSVVASAVKAGGAVPALAPVGQMYEMGEHRLVPIDMRALVRVQTPQVFRAAPLLAVYRAAAEAGFEGVDTAETVERFSDLEIAAVPGDERNFKITLPADLALAEAHFKEMERKHSC